MIIVPLSTSTLNVWWMVKNYSLSQSIITSLLLLNVGSYWVKQKQGQELVINKNIREKRSETSDISITDTLQARVHCIACICLHSSHFSGNYLTYPNPVSNILDLDKNWSKMFNITISDSWSASTAQSQGLRETLIKWWMCQLSSKLGKVSKV